MSLFKNIIYVDSKSWNERLRKECNCEKARYFERSFIVASNDDKLIFPEVKAVENKFNECKSTDKYFYTVIAKKTKLYKLSESGYYRRYKYSDSDIESDGYYVTVRLAAVSEEGTILDMRYSLCSICEQLEGKESNMFHSFAKKFTPVSSEYKKSITTSQVLKDKFGVVIEIGDFVAHPSGTYGGGSSVSISEITRFGVGTVNGWKPERLIVVRAKDPDKKLGW